MTSLRCLIVYEDENRFWRPPESSCFQDLQECVKKNFPKLQDNKIYVKINGIKIIITCDDDIFQSIKLFEETENPKQKNFLKFYVERIKKQQKRKKVG